MHCILNMDELLRATQFDGDMEALAARKKDVPNIFTQEQYGLLDQRGMDAADFLTVSWMYKYKCKQM